MTDSMFVITNEPHGRSGSGRSGLPGAAHATVDMTLAMQATRYPGASRARAMHDA